MEIATVATAAVISPLVAKRIKRIVTRTIVKADGTEQTVTSEEEGKEGDQDEAQEETNEKGEKVITRKVIRRVRVVKTVRADGSQEVKEIPDDGTKVEQYLVATPVQQESEVKDREITDVPSMKEDVPVKVEEQSITVPNKEEITKKEVVIPGSTKNDEEQDKVKSAYHDANQFLVTRDGNRNCRYSSCHISISS